MAGVFSAPFQPNPGVNCGTNNQIWQQTHGSPVTLSAWGGDNGDTGKITTDGLVVENAIVNGVLNVRANDVTFRNCLIQGGALGSDPVGWALYCINASFGFSGLLIEDCEITRGDSSNLYIENAVVRRCYLHDTRSDLLKTKDGAGRGNTTVESCYFTTMGHYDVDPAAHADAWQHRGSGGNLVCRWNYFNIPGFFKTPSNRIHSASIIWQNKGGDGAILENNVIDSNWFYGGTNTILVSARVADHKECYIINNKFYGETSDYDNDEGYTTNSGPWIGMGWTRYMLMASENAPYTLEYHAYNNRLYDGTLAYKTGSGPNSYNASLIDNLTAPPSIPFYDSGTVNKVDLSTGITLRIGADELSKSVLIY